jgi:hypothetical protein
MTDGTGDSKLIHQPLAGIPGTTCVTRIAALETRLRVLKQWETDRLVWTLRVHLAVGTNAVSTGPVEAGKLADTVRIHVAGTPH